MDRRAENATFIVRCVGYTQDYEKKFTIGNLYEVWNEEIISDDGFVYTDFHMKPNSDPSKWVLAAWYKFEIVEQEDTVIPESLTISYDDLF